MVMIALTQVQDLAFMGAIWAQCFKILLGPSPPLKPINCTPQCGVISTVSEAALSPTGSVVWFEML